MLTTILRSALPRAAFMSLALAATGFPAAAEFSKAQKAEIEAVIKEYLINNPEVLRDAQVEMDRRQKLEEIAAREQSIKDQAAEIFNSPFQAVAGNPNGKITLVEFFDYNCGYCKRAMDDMTRLIKADPELRVVLKDFPVLGPGSIEAAQIASAARVQLPGDKFLDFHLKLLGTRGPVGKAQALKVATDMGLDMAKLEKDANDASVKKGIEGIMQVANSLNLTGTPSYVLGTDVIVGAVGYDEIKAKLDNVKKCGKVACS